MKREVEKHDGGKRGGTTEEEREFITKALYNWCLRLLTALFNYITYFIGNNSDHYQLPY